jgi:hypothetical protein
MEFERRGDPFRLRYGWIACTVVLAGLASCQRETAESRVSYRSSPALGSWFPEAEPASGSPAGAAAPLASSTGFEGGSGGAPAPATERSGTPAPPPIAGRGPEMFGAGQAGADASAAGMGGAAGGPALPAGLSQLSFQVLTHSQGGKYAPKNVGAIWIETSTGAFVKTLEVWAGTRARYLRRWTSEARSSRVDAVSSATLRGHATHTATWDCTDAAGSAVAPGAYKVVIEVTDYDGAGQSAEVPFTSDQPGMITPPDMPAYTGMLLRLQ